MSECVINISEDIIEKLNNGSVYANVSPSSLINALLREHFYENGYYDKMGNKVSPNGDVHDYLGRLVSKSE